VILVTEALKNTRARDFVLLASIRVVRGFVLAVIWLMARS
jgi:hypothetical protein